MRNNKIVFWGILGTICGALFIFPTVQVEQPVLPPVSTSAASEGPLGAAPSTYTKTAVNNTNANTTGNSQVVSVVNQSKPKFIPSKLSELPEGAFKDKVMALSPHIQTNVAAQLEKLQIPYNNLASLSISESGFLIMHCRQIPLTAAATYMPTEDELEIAHSLTTVGVENLPPISTNPGAEYTVYINFTGGEIRNTGWNSDQNPVFWTKSFSIDSDHATFSGEEQLFIRDVVELVNRFFISFGVNVTTIKPEVFDQRNLQVLITAPTDWAGKANPFSTSAGVAFLNVVDYHDAAFLTPVWVYHHTDRNAAHIASVAAHELGHNFGLSHDGTNTSEYYSGHPVGDYDWWTPIMGSAGTGVVQWSRGEYRNSNNPQDDIAIIANYTGLTTSDGNDGIGSLGTSLVEITDFITPVKESSSVIFEANTTMVDIEVQTLAYINSLNHRNMRGLFYNLQLTNLNTGLSTPIEVPLNVWNVEERGFATAKLPLTVGHNYQLTATRIGLGSPMDTTPTGFTKYGSTGELHMALKGSNTPTPTPTPVPTPVPTPPVTTPPVVTPPSFNPPPTVITPSNPNKEQLELLEKQLADARKIRNPQQRAQRIRSITNQINRLKGGSTNVGTGGNSAKLAALNRQLAKARRIANPRQRAQRIQRLQAEIAEIRRNN